MILDRKLKARLLPAMLFAVAAVGVNEATHSSEILGVGQKQNAPNGKPETPQTGDDPAPVAVPAPQVLKAKYQKFLVEHPSHPDARDVQMAFARLQIQLAKTAVNPKDAQVLLTQARARIGVARKLFTAELAKVEARWKSFPPFIDRKKDAKQFAERRQVESEFLIVQLQLATCGYVESQTYDIGSNEHEQSLTKAARGFEQIHRKYRTQVAGLQGRLWQGKCLEELGEIRHALGIFNELLQHGGRGKPLRQLGNQAQHFRMICLNHDSRRDWELVVVESKNWIRDSTEAERNSSAGLGILWEKSRALIGTSRNPKSAGTMLRSLGEEVGDDPSGQLKRLGLDLQQELRNKNGGFDVSFVGSFRIRVARLDRW
ncbi:MAG: hypothetical protein O3A00_00670 [Planctomycetota bacterium]|nr:hypothetical protein [Planctomycetota bacterium]